MTISVNTNHVGADRPAEPQQDHRPAAGYAQNRVTTGLEGRQARGQRLGLRHRPEAAGVALGAVAR